jgi:tetratricopeptide (TPR) repeat protein
MSKRLFVLVFACLLATTAKLQQTTLYTDAYGSYKQAQTFFQEGLYAKAALHYHQTLDRLQPANFAEAEQLKVLSQLGIARTAIRLDQPDAEKLILDFIRAYTPDPIAGQATQEVANYYFDKRSYQKSLDYFSQLSIQGLSREEKGRAYFRMGYANFELKKYDEARRYFMQAKEFDVAERVSAIYYLGFCYFQKGEYENALSEFTSIKNEQPYDKYIPLYLGQIYFTEKRFDEVIRYLEPSVTANRRNKAPKEYYQLLGQSYFELGEYAKALPLLEYYAEQSRQMTEEEFYQLGFVQYKSGQVDKAIRNFREISASKNSLAQSANYYLADCYLRKGDKPSARYAFGNVMRMKFDATLSEEATFQYGKLSLELRDPDETVNALRQLSPSSQYYAEAQTLMGEAFLSYRNYEKAIEVMERIANKPPQLQDTYKKVLLYRGLQLIKDNRPADAKTVLMRGRDIPGSQFIQAQILYWLADVAHKERLIDQSIAYLNQYFTVATSQSKLPEESSIFVAQYLMAYNYLAKDDQAKASQFFQQCVDGINRNRATLRNPEIRDKIYADALMRTADAFFKRNNYDQALRYYDQVITNTYPNYDYAMLSKAQILGLRKDWRGQIKVCDALLNPAIRTKYADRAAFMKAEAYRLLGQTDQYRQTLKDLVERFKGTSELLPQALLLLGESYFQSSYFEESALAYREVFRYNPTPVEEKSAEDAIREIYLDHMNDSRKYEEFVRTRPNAAARLSSIDSLVFNAAMNKKIDLNYSDAIDGFTDYINKYPTGSYLLKSYYYRGECHSSLKQFTMALNDYTYLIDRGPSPLYESSLQIAAEILYNQEKDYRRAYTYYAKLEQVATDVEDQLNAQRRAMQAAYESKQFTEVTAMANKLIANRSANAIDLSLANYYKGKIAFDRNELNAAITAFDETIRLSDDERTAEARYLRAMCYYKLEQYDRAEQLCKDANKDSSQYPYWVAKTVILLGDVFFSKGELYTAKSIFESILENYEDESDDIRSETRSRLDKTNAQLNAGSRIRSGN